MKVVLAHLDKRFAQEQLYSNAVKTSASSTPCIAARATRPVPTSKSAAKNDMLIFIRSLPFSVSAYDIGNNRATPFRAMEFMTVEDQKPLGRDEESAKAEIKAR
jgi:hypothetical protein